MDTVNEYPEEALSRETFMCGCCKTPFSDEESDKVYRIMEEVMSLGSSWGREGLLCDKCAGFNEEGKMPHAIRAVALAAERGSPDYFMESFYVIYYGDSGDFDIRSAVYEHYEYETYVAAVVIEGDDAFEHIKLEWDDATRVQAKKEE